MRRAVGRSAKLKEQVTTIDFGARSMAALLHHPFRPILVGVDGRGTVKVRPLLTHSPVLADAQGSRHTNGPSQSAVDRQHSGTSGKSLEIAGKSTYLSC